MADRTTDVWRSQGGRAISEPHRAHRRRLGTRSRLVVSTCAVAAVCVAAPPTMAWATVPSQADDASSVLDEESTVGENPLLVDGPVVAAVATQDEGEEPATGDDSDAVLDEPADDSSTVDPGTDAVSGDDSTDGSNNDEAEATVRLVMFALIGVAVLLALLTAYYWWRTRPARRPEAPARRSWEGDEAEQRSTDASAPAEATGP